MLAPMRPSPIIPICMKASLKYRDGPQPRRPGSIMVHNPGSVLHTCGSSATDMMRGVKLCRTMPASNEITSASTEMLHAAATAYGTRDWATAERLCRLILTDGRDRFEALNLLGIIQAQTRRLDEAAVLLARAVAARPDNATVHNNYANVLRDLGRPGEAVAEYDLARLGDGRALVPADPDGRTRSVRSAEPARHHSGADASAGRSGSAAGARRRRAARQRDGAQQLRQRAAGSRTPGRSRGRIRSRGSARPGLRRGFQQP